MLPRNLGSTIFVAQLPFFGFFGNIAVSTLSSLPLLLLLGGRWVPDHRSQQGEAAARSGTCSREAPAGCKVHACRLLVCQQMDRPPATDGPHWPPNFRYFQVCLVDSAERKKVTNDF